MRLNYVLKKYSNHSRLNEKNRNEVDFQVKEAEKANMIESTS